MYKCFICLRRPNSHQWYCAWNTSLIYMLQNNRLPCNHAEGIFPIAWIRDSSSRRTKTWAMSRLLSITVSSDLDNFLFCPKIGPLNLRPPVEEATIRILGLHMFNALGFQTKIIHMFRPMSTSLFLQRFSCVSKLIMVLYCMLAAWRFPLSLTENEKQEKCGNKLDIAMNILMCL